jgi:hypothetical protein
VSREFADGGLRAVLTIDLIEEEEARTLGRAALCAIDHVRFDRLPAEGSERVPLADVPPLVFSEAMRDVDLFVAVTSIASDPTWMDRGGERRFDAYWSELSGPLTETAVSRRAALLRLLPRTAIADRCEVGEREVVVRGNLGTYRIHIGSGRVLMEPDTYLCIVPGRRVDLSDRLYLPFEEEGDRLSVIVSLAFLLAGDDKITDPTILAQLGRP